MNIKEKIEELVEKISGDKDLRSRFEKQPVKVLEDLLGINLPDDKVEELIEGIRAKLTLDKVGDVLGGLFGRK